LLTQEGFLATLTEVDTFDSPAQAFTSENGIPNARGRILGGSSAINAGFYSRTDQELYQKSGGDLRVVNESYVWDEPNPHEIVFFGGSYMFCSTSCEYSTGMKRS